MASQHCHAWSLLTILFNHFVNNHHMFLASVSSSSIPQAASNVCKSWWCLDALTGPLPCHLCKSVSSDSVKESWLLSLLFRNQLEIASMCGWYDKGNTNSAVTNVKILQMWSCEDCLGSKNCCQCTQEAVIREGAKTGGNRILDLEKGKWGDFSNCETKKSCSSGKLK